MSFFDEDLFIVFKFLPNPFLVHKNDYEITMRNKKILNYSRYFNLKDYNLYY